MEMIPGTAFSQVNNNPIQIVGEILTTDQRLLLLGETGIGKSALAAAIADAIARAGRSCWCISPDPGTPAFGVPGAVSLGLRQDHYWQTVEQQPICILDAARFRLPLISAMQELLNTDTHGTLLIDAPGTVRGAAGAELLYALANVSRASNVMVLVREGKRVPLSNELRSLNASV